MNETKSIREQRETDHDMKITPVGFLELRELSTFSFPTAPRVLASYTLRSAHSLVINPSEARPEGAAYVRRRYGRRSMTGRSSLTRAMRDIIKG